MTLNEKADAVWEGMFIGDRVESNLRVQLYCVGNFYAEVYYESQGNDIIKIRGFTTTRLIEPYLHTIKLDLK
ncbi:hypothetical protein GWR56_13740 [Mucilaginibacter sp. 14171R-50]|uniref:hypothetical protein n=1 Tax=Mucilaginibacter sp. 14171R-50 TaxID=2703789 RepID=UPI00138D6065|nr:hypothetical protein [Mucilaginibacter sp. 14171R-50]QHS56551.1 hypothetical protein GWR56_13740 [Mucilaginibacter sp. 14171R-50]